LYFNKYLNNRIISKYLLVIELCRWMSTSIDFTVLFIGRYYILSLHRAKYKIVIPTERNNAA